MASKKPEERVREIDGIPTAHGLTIMGRQYAEYTATGHIRITDQGNRLLSQELRGAGQDAVKEGVWRGVSGAYSVPPAQPGYIEIERHKGAQHGRDKS